MSIETAPERDQLIVVLDAHVEQRRSTGCGCGWAFPPGSGGRLHAEYLGHIADDLRERFPSIHDRWSRQDLVAALSDHVDQRRSTGCGCGWTFPPGSGGRLHAEYLEHIADTLLPPLSSGVHAEAVRVVMAAMDQARAEFATDPTIPHHDRHVAATIVAALGPLLVEGAHSTQWGVYPVGYAAPVKQPSREAAEVDQFAEHYDWVDGTTPPRLMLRDVTTYASRVGPWRDATDSDVCAEFEPDVEAATLTPCDPGRATNYDND